MSQIVNSPFTFVGGSDFGAIYRPYVFVSVYSKFTNSWRDVRMVVDSGADYTLLPKKYAAILGIDLEKECVYNSSQGIGGEEKICFYKNLPVKIKNWETKIPVGFILRNSIPPLLGRAGCLEALKVIFEKRRTVFEN